MSDQVNEIDVLFRRRNTLIGNISLKNADHLRMLQLSGGIEVLLLKDDESPNVNQNKSDTDSKIATSLIELSELETELTEIDKQIEFALNKEP